MLNLTAKSKYGLAAILAIATTQDHRPVQSKTIAEQYRIPQPYLEQLLLDLKKAGVIHSVRGCQGGYTLAKSPEQLTVLDVVLSLEGSSDFCAGMATGTLETFWRHKEMQINDLFQVTIATLVAQDQKAKYVMAYSI
jgi:Rrf2 family transcriptional regulator, cysteine metabolism repressor